MANFKATSRYSTAIVTTNREGQNFIVLRNSLNLSPEDGDTFYQVTQETLNRPDLISQIFYGNPDYWWVIYDFNGIKDPLFELQLNQILRIPAIERVLSAIQELGA